MFNYLIFNVKSNFKMYDQTGEKNVYVSIIKLTYSFKL